MKEENKLNENTINFVSRTSKNNGVSSIVKRIENIVPNPKNTISVAVSGSVLESFFHPYEYYSGRDLYYLEPLIKMSLEEIIFYCQCIKSNSWKYSYGRQANKTLEEILLPEKHEIPNWVYENKIPEVNNIGERIYNEKINIDTTSWKKIDLNIYFYIDNGKSPSLSEAQKNKGIIPFISATTLNNGISTLTSFEPRHMKNSLTIASDGNGVCTSFYQEKDFLGQSVLVLTPKEDFKFNKYIAMFLITLINKNSYKFSYGRKLPKERINNLDIKLPVDKKGEPDWNWIENYIKTLAFSSNI
jgi:hypothetical protein